MLRRIIERYTQYMIMDLALVFCDCCNAVWQELKTKHQILAKQRDVNCEYKLGKLISFLMQDNIASLSSQVKMAEALIDEHGSFFNACLITWMAS